MASQGINWRAGAASVLIGLVALSACNADRSGTIVSTKPAASVVVDNCTPSAGANTVTWANADAAVASVQVVYALGTATSASAWTTVAPAATSGSVRVSAPAAATSGSWVVSSVVTATSKNGGGTKTTVKVSCSATGPSGSATPMTAAPRGT